MQTCNENGIKERKIKRKKEHSEETLWYDGNILSLDLDVKNHLPKHLNVCKFYCS